MQSFNPPPCQLLGTSVFRSYALGDLLVILETWQVVCRRRLYGGCAWILGVLRVTEWAVYATYLSLDLSMVLFASGRNPPGVKFKLLQAGCISFAYLAGFRHRT